MTCRRVLLLPRTAAAMALALVCSAQAALVTQAYVKASNTGESDLFGVSIAVSGDTMVVGARNESSNASGVNGNQNDNSAVVAGAAYVSPTPAAAASRNWCPATDRGVITDNTSKPLMRSRHASFKRVW